jgi:hypothetical protein
MNIIKEIACPYQVQAHRILSGLFLEGDSTIEQVDVRQDYVVDVYINHKMSHLEAFKKFVHSKQDWDIRSPHWVTWKKSTNTLKYGEVPNICNRDNEIPSKYLISHPPICKIVYNFGDARSYGY